MNYVSTRNIGIKVTASQAITKGISAEGGLFVPENLPKVSMDTVSELAKLDYIGRAKSILSLFLTDFTEAEVDSCVKGAYETGFSDVKVAPLAKIEDGVHILELFKGPTCAFKDMALQILPRLLTVSSGKAAKGTKIVILVATSGDTGKAALEGFKDVENTQILVFYPSDGVSPMQKLQMCTQEGNNVSVCAIEGNFDDAQSGVKRIFTDKAIGEKLAANSMAFSSANSINWGRLCPQIVYYFSAYCDLLASGEIKAGDEINVVVPTGNFGNILAAYYAKEMGLPVKKLICASNSNSVLTEFLTTGVYDRNREFFTTISPSMDILISSNLERLLYSVSGSENVKNWMKQLSEDGKYEVDAATLDEIKAVFAAGCCDDTETKETIAKVFNEKGYLCDTHTAVAVKVYYDYKEKTGDSTPAVIASTASPFKFSAAVLEAVAGGTEGLDEFEMVERLAEVTGKACPEQLANLRNKAVRFDGCCSKDKMDGVVFNMLGI
ncbi:MAG: threonine synthase [Acutalibacteraceae bacterium]|nr:threonine synthase [Acutalibacteraceae bacterium]